MWYSLSSGWNSYLRFSRRGFLPFKKMKTEETNTYFSSDWHLFHANIIKYCKRPFEDSSKMNRTILDNMNSRITENDWLYFLGDMALVSDEKHLIYWLDGLRCKNICFIKGNHDKTASKIYSRFFWYKDIAEIRVQDQSVVLCHYSMNTWNRSHRGSWHLYGHSHGTLPDNPNSMSMDVGVDTNNFYPYSFEDIKKRMSLKTFIPKDHHK